MFALLRLYYAALSARIRDWIKIFRTRRERPTSDPHVAVERICIPSRYGRMITAYKYTPRDLSGEGPHPVHINWHASGFVLKRLGLDSHRCLRIAKEVGTIVLDCDYSKGPERQFPAAQDDAEDAVHYVLARPGKYDPARITLGGSSAGGALALSMSLVFGRDRIRACFSLYPVSEWGPLETIAKDKPLLNETVNSGIVLDESRYELFYAAYIPETTDLKDERLSPIYGDVKRLPEYVLLACGDADTLYLDSKRMYEKIMNEGTDAQRKHTQFLTFPNEAHEFNHFPEHQDSRDARDRVYDAAIGMLHASIQ